MLSFPNHSLLLHGASMAKFLPHKRLLPFLFYFFSLRFSSAEYNLPQNYFINCGSSSTITGVYSLRDFVGDEKSPGISLSSETSSSVVDPAPSSIELYRTARIFRKPSTYELEIHQSGTHVVRFHFSPLLAFGNLSDARFSVEAANFRVLSEFSSQNAGDLKFPRIEEFLVTISVGKLRIKFVPDFGGNAFGFVNAIEVFFAPPDFVPGSAIALNVEGNLENYTDLLVYPLRVIHRVNVGGSNIMPNNDTLLRNWIPDDVYLSDKNAAKNSDLYTGKLYYQKGMATEFDAPNSVYNTAKEPKIDDKNRPNSSNILWRFDVKKGAKHLLRVHFCDIVSVTSNEGLRFNLSIYRKFEQEIYPYGTVSQTAAPFYKDFVVDSDHSGFLNISVGSQSDSLIAFLNGVEIFELVTESVPSQEGSNSKKGLLLIVIGSVVGGVLLVFIFLAFLFLCLCKGKRKLKNDLSSHYPVALFMGGSGESKDGIVSGSSHDLNLGLRLSFAEILYATKKFDHNSIIGEGGFGKVYKGMLRNGTKVAVKRSEAGHGQGFSEFHTEVSLLSKINHHHLVSLIGYCDESNEMILVYEFMEKGTLRDHLYLLEEESGVSRSMNELSWEQRLRICIGAAKGIHYLHTGSSGAIIHRDIKSTNILLDEDYVAKVADFGLSRLGPSDQTHVSTVVKGSFGYLDPDYLRCSQLTLKSDVYSFGVVLLEVLCGRPPINNLLPRDEVSLTEWALSRLRKGEIDKIVDPFLLTKSNPNSLRKFGETVEKCLQEYGDDRPNMVDVLWDLEYTLQLQRTAVPNAPYDDSTMDVSLSLQMNVLQRFPSLSELTEEDGLHSFSDVSQVNANEAFSQLKIGDAR